eukprot:TRINITY_DN4211_c0_g1_i2.p1 TRINITY_DN4211_c0_g1~~TRINITY_DN4211_c0_g1_i2.p1  ORF type:complete len:166 (-),score=39.11 TRINITY_DN4211_c0_g1_i2:22-459(-)
MSPVTVTGIINAPPAVVWDVNFSDMKWEKWDPDLSAVEQSEAGCTDGATCMFVMKNGMRLLTHLEVLRYERLTFSGAGMRGSMGFKGTFQLQPAEGGSKTELVYSFDMSGLMGLLVKTFNSKAVVSGTQAGFENVKKNAEFAVEC